MGTANICAKYTCSEQGCSHGGDFYLDVDVPIFAYDSMASYIRWTSISCTPHFLVWRQRKSPLLVLIQMLDLCLTVVSILAPEAVSVSPKLSLHSKDILNVPCEVCKYKELKNLAGSGFGS